MALNNRLVTEWIRQKLGEANASKAARTLIMIPTALKETGRKIAADGRLRPLLQTDPTSVTATITNGAVDLAALYASDNIFLEYLDKGQITHEDYDYPCQTVTPNQKNLTFYQSEWLQYYVQGNTLYVIPSDTTGDLAFAVPYFPATLSAMPDSTEAETIFLETLLELLMTDAPEDK
mgnify:FL=1